MGRPSFIFQSIFPKFRLAPSALAPLPPQAQNASYGPACCLGQLTQELTDVKTNLYKIKERYDTTDTHVYVYLALVLATAINLILLLVLLGRLYRRRAGTLVANEPVDPGDHNNLP